MPNPPPGYRFDPFADARMGRSLFDMAPDDWLVPDRVSLAAARLGAKPAGDIPGLWVLDGYPELTDGQLLQIAGERPPR